MDVTELKGGSDSYSTQVMLLLNLDEREPVMAGALEEGHTVKTQH